jgi:asparagine synthetase B (glutamine-hydrolysing)
MCGIYFSLSRNGYIAPNAGIELLLKNRGPDSIGEHHALIPAESSSDQASSVQLHATFLSTVLALRGTAIVEQPLKDDETGSALCWNGEAWSIHGHLDSIPGNDSQAVFALLLQATHVPSPDGKSSSVELVLRTLSAIRGPYAFVFYDAKNNILFFGRDCLGRRSLLRQSTSDDRLVLSSVRDSASGDKWAEVEPDGIYMVDLQSSHSNDAVLNVTHVPHRREGEPKTNQLSFVGKFSNSLMFAEPASIYRFQP